MKNGRDIGLEHLDTLQAFLRSGQSLPQGRDGSVNLSELARLSGIPKSSFYQNPAIRILVAGLRAAPDPQEVGGAKPVLGEQKRAMPSGVEHRQTKLLERRVNQLEQQNAALVAENAELRRQLKLLRLQMGREDMVIETGRRIPNPLGSHA